MTENMEGKPKQEKQGEEKQKLHAAMDKELEKICTQLAICKEEGDTDGWWKGWSQAIEKTFSEYLNDEALTKAMLKNAKGRGEVKTSRKNTRTRSGNGPQCMEMQNDL